MNYDMTMTIREYEEMIVREIDGVVLKIIQDNMKPGIPANLRAGAEISDFLEANFIKYANDNKYLKDSEQSPKGATKNPWDVKTTFCFKKLNETIWIDFKALKTSSKNSNPDIGTPTKIIDFIKKGNFYYLYVYVYYQKAGKGLKFVEWNGKLTKSYFLKDISPSFRRNPKNQLQVNMSDLPGYRTREEFIKLLFEKLIESHKRQKEISEYALKYELVDEKKNELIKINNESESKILKSLQ